MVPELLTEPLPLVLAEIVAAGNEILIGDIGRGGEQATDIDDRPIAEQKAVGIEQPHLAIGADGAVDGGSDWCPSRD